MSREEDDELRRIVEELESLRKQVGLPDRVEKVEKDAIQNALYETDGNQTLAAKKLGLGRTCLIAKMKKYGII